MTAMYRSDWEVAIHVRHHIASLADERRVHGAPDQVESGTAAPLTRFRQRLGSILIEVGHALAGHDAPQGLPTPLGQPATCVPGSGS